MLWWYLAVSLQEHFTSLLLVKHFNTVSLRNGCACRSFFTIQTERSL